MQLANIIECREFHNQTHVFRDRQHAGNVLARMTEEYRTSQAIVLGIPAGGVPVAGQLAKHLDLPLDVAVVSKITLPWNTEAGYGALAFDGTVRLNQDLLARLSLKPGDVDRGMAETKEKVRRRIKLFRKDAPMPPLSGRPVVLVDDGLASGFTMLVAIEAVSKAGASLVVVTVPTGHSQAVERIAAKVDRVYCANVRSGWSFAVADAYEQWSDVTEEEALSWLSHLGTPVT